MYLDIAMVNALLRAFLASATKIPESSIVIENRTGPRPQDKSPYISILWLEQELLNQFDAPFSQPDTDIKGLENLENEAHCSVRITVRGDDAYNIASEIRYLLDSSERSFDLWNILGFSGIGSVLDLSANYGGKIQQRAHIDLDFYAAFGRRYELDWFKNSPWIINGFKSIYPYEVSVCQ